MKDDEVAEDFHQRVTGSAAVQGLNWRNHLQELEELGVDIAQLPMTIHSADLSITNRQTSPKRIQKAGAEESQQQNLRAPEQRAWALKSCRKPNARR
jgi:hypothetical protein